MKQLADAARPETLDRLLDLRGHGLAVDGPLHLAEHADAGGLVRPRDRWASANASDGLPCASWATIASGGVLASR